MSSLWAGRAGAVQIQTGSGERCGARSLWAARTGAAQIQTGFGERNKAYTYMGMDGENHREGDGEKPPAAMVKTIGAAMVKT